MTSLRRLALLAVAVSVVASGCSSDPTPPTSALAPADADGGSGATPGAVTGCPLTADRVVELVLAPSDFTEETVTSGASLSWELTARPTATIPALTPGESLAVSLRFEGAPVRILREGRSFYVTIEAATSGTTRAQATPELVAASAGELTPGPWQPSLSVRADGRPIRLVLGGIDVNPNAGERLSCFSARATLPRQANSVEDSSLVAVAPSEPMPITVVRLSVTGDPPATPFALSL